MAMRKKLIIAIACLSVVLCTLISGTIAYLIAETKTIENTFTPSNIALALTETPAEFKGKMIPGAILDKKVTVTVTNDIPCYVFVEVVKANKIDDYIQYAVDASWKIVPTTDNTLVYYQEVAAKETGSSTFNVLGGGVFTFGGVPYKWDAGKVLVRPDVTKAMMDVFYDANGNLLTGEALKQPTLTFAAYAIQSDYLAYPADAEGATDQQKADAKALFAWNTLKANPNPKVDTAAVG